MSALDRLEGQLARSVDSGAASHAASASTTTAHSAHRRRFPRVRGPRLFVLALLTVGVTTGALAATGVLRIAPEQNDPRMPFAADEGPGVVQGPARILPLRVADPQGGPPWVIRTFSTSRGGACVQGGQLSRGHFGQVERDTNGAPVFRLSGAYVGAINTRCTTRAVDGLPVANGLRMTHIDGGEGSPERCSPAHGRKGACPVRAVTVVRFGLLGPQAERAAWVGADGKVAAEQRIAPGTGGAYLIARAVDARPYQQWDVLGHQIEEEATRRFPPPSKRRAGLSPSERAAADRQVRARITYLMQRYEATRAERRELGRQMAGSESIRASFFGGTRLVVAGLGRDDDGPLPGVPTFRIKLPASVRMPVQATLSSSRSAVRVRFRSPIDMTRMGAFYSITVRGPAQACRHHDESRYVMFQRSVRRGERVTVSVPPSASQGRGRWCTGRVYTARVRLQGGGSPGFDREVGRTTVNVR